MKDTLRLPRRSPHFFRMLTVASGVFALTTGCGTEVNEPDTMASVVAAVSAEQLQALLELDENCVDADCSVELSVIGDNETFLFNTHRAVAIPLRQGRSDGPQFFTGYTADGGPADNLRLTIFAGSKEPTFTGTAYVDGTAIPLGSFQPPEATTTAAGNVGGLDVQSDTCTAQKTENGLFQPSLTVAEAQASIHAGPRILEIATDADFEMFQRWELDRGIRADDIILGYIHSANGLLEPQLNVRAVVVYQYTWRHRADPYTGNTLLDRLKEFEATHMGRFDGHLLFTGRYMTDPTLGLARIGAACRTDALNTGTIVARENDYRTMTTTAHELTHLLGAEHDEGDCSGDTRSLMCAHVPASGTAVVSQETKNQVNAYLAGVTCLAQETAVTESTRACERVTLDPRLSEALPANWQNNLNYDQSFDVAISDHYRHAPDDHRQLNTFPGSCTIRNAVNQFWTSTLGFKADAYFYDARCESGTQFFYGRKSKTLDGAFMGREINAFNGVNDVIFQRTLRYFDASDIEYAVRRRKDDDRNGLYNSLVVGPENQPATAYGCTSENQMLFTRLPSGVIHMSAADGGNIDCDYGAFNELRGCKAVWEPIPNGNE